MSTTATATYRSNYTVFTADTTRSPKAANTVIRRINTQFLNQQNQDIQEKEVMPNYGGSSEKCARCSKTVYVAEKKVGAGRSFHTRCFSCQTCNRKLESTTLCEHKGEIYCRPCYTKQFGVHGIANGVSMSTDTTARDAHPARRSSYGSELEVPVKTPEPIRQRAHSNDNILRGEYGALCTDELPKIFPWRNDILPDQHSSTINKIATELNPIVDKNYQRPASPIGFQNVIETTGSDTNYRQSTLSRDDDRHKHKFDDEKTNYTNRISAFVDVPVIPSPKRSTSTIERIEIPLLPANSDTYIRDPSPLSTDVYRRQSSREHQVDLSDNFSRLTLNDQQQKNDNEPYSDKCSTTGRFIPENTVLKPTYSRSSSNEDKQPIPTTNNFYSEQRYSRDSSSSVTVNSNRSPSPTSGYASSSVHGESRLRDSTSPSAVNVSQHDYLNTRPSNASVNSRYPTSPQQSERTPSALHEFVGRTNIPIIPPGERYSTIGALVHTFRPLKDEFEN
ncbi:unnamed protein product [Rotaria socialis]|uniref:LIM zinc-binding domain-containing protein n=1 Tax=Rotaria socialis TaxID=392032 RepID=A0A820CI48_9BILA|nr:unnamed protein product [Rotaria socialis]CAF3530054.1 unnamed protein product [Rotaria socialis]CAF3718975.1 unnamed protein product [Rotaria socialis]CAF3776935.1 unnamed protein product [Rotaria socialis]CAF4139620.1 unnamed protein product [Rotaria socialis]